jgi:D-erythro-7,8-dihydroneopterin triphosphate epimerase
MKLIIKNLEVFMFLGIYNYEKQNLTKVHFNIIIEVKTPKLSNVNNLNDFLNYDTIARKIKSHFEGKNFDLIEDVIFETATLLQNNEKTSNFRIAITKFNTHNFIESITIEEDF